MPPAEPEDPDGPGRESAAGDWVAPATTLDALDRHADEVVRVGGRVKRIDGRRLTLDDGTAEVDVRLAAAVEPFEPALQVDEVLNVVGRVRAARRPRGHRAHARGRPSGRRRPNSQAAWRRAAEATGLASALLPGVMATAGSSDDPRPRSDAPMLLPLVLVLAGLAVLLLGGAVVSLAWPRLGERWHLAGRMPPGQPDRSDPNRPAAGMGSGPM